MRNVMTQLDAAPVILDVTDRPALACQRITDCRPFRAEIDIDLRTCETDRVEQDGAGAFGPDAGRVRKVANALLVLVDRDEVDDVLNGIIVQVEAGLAPAAEVMGKVGLKLPNSAGAPVEGSRHCRGRRSNWAAQKIVEADLANPAAQLEADVPRLAGMPSEHDTAFGTEEFASRLLVGRAI